MKKLLLTTIAALFLATGAAHAQNMQTFRDSALAGQSVLPPNPVTPPFSAIALVAQQELPLLIVRELLSFVIVQAAPQAQRVNDEEAASIRHRCAVPGNRDSARLRRLRERRDRRTAPAPDEHNKAGDQIGHAPQPAS